MLHWSSKATSQLKDKLGSHLEWVGGSCRSPAGSCWDEDCGLSADSEPDASPRSVCAEYVHSVTCEGCELYPSDFDQRGDCGPREDCGPRGGGWRACSGGSARRGSVQSGPMRRWRYPCSRSGVGWEVVVCSHWLSLRNVAAEEKTTTTLTIYLLYYTYSSVHTLTYIL